MLYTGGCDTCYMQEVVIHVIIQEVVIHGCEIQEVVIQEVVIQVKYRRL